VTTGHGRTGLITRNLKREVIKIGSGEQKSRSRACGYYLFSPLYSNFTRTSFCGEANTVYTHLHAHKSYSQLTD